DAENTPPFAEHLAFGNEVRELANGPDLGSVVFEIAAKSIRNAIADPCPASTRHPYRPEFSACCAVHSADSEKKNGRRDEQRNERKALCKPERKNQNFDEP